MHSFAGFMDRLIDEAARCLGGLMSVAESIAQPIVVAGVVGFVAAALGVYVAVKVLENNIRWMREGMDSLRADFDTFRQEQRADIGELHDLQRRHVENYHTTRRRGSG